jgi:hypothetical protein
MSFRSCLFALLLVPAFAGAQNILDARTANVLPLWKKGDRFAYTVTTTEKSYEKGVLDESKSSSFKLTFTVLDTNGGLRMEQRISDFKVVENTKGQPMEKEEKALLDRVMSMYSATPVIFTCDRDGNVQALENTEQVVQGTQNYVNDVMKMIPNDTLRALLAGFLEGLMTPEIVADQALEHAHTMHMLHGGGYTVAERIDQEVELPNVLGGDPIPGRYTAVMNTMDARTGKATFTVTVTLDPAQLQAALKSYIAKLVEATGEKLDAASEREISEAFRSMKLTETYNVSMNLNGANVTKLTYKQEVLAGPSRQVEEQNYQLLP